MVDANIGETRFNWRGPYDAVALYEPDDVVSHGGSSWICVADGVRNRPLAATRSAPAPASPDWQLMAKGQENVSLAVNPGATTAFGRDADGDHWLVANGDGNPADDVIKRRVHGFKSDGTTVTQQQLYVDGKPALTIDRAGRTFMPNQTAFLAHVSGAYRPRAIVSYDVVRYNIGNGYNQKTHKFTAPVAGRYMFYWHTIGGMAHGTYSSDIKVNDVLYYRARPVTSATHGGYSGAPGDGTGVCILSLAQNDYVYIYQAGTRQGFGNNIHAWFGGYLMG